MTIEGKVVHGLGNAGRLEFPTANIQLDEDMGIAAYFGKCKVMATELGACLCTVIHDVAEVHILGFEGDLYGRELIVEEMVLIPDAMLFYYMSTVLNDRITEERGKYNVLTA